MKQTKILIFAVSFAYLTVHAMRRYEDMFNGKNWYLLRLTQEGALKWATILNQKFPRGDVAIVNVIENNSIDPKDIRSRDIAFHVRATRKEMMGLKMLLGEQMVLYKKLEGK